MGIVVDHGTGSAFQSPPWPVEGRQKSMSAKSGSVYLCYFPLSEPLVESQVLSYLKGLAAAGFRIHLITFELSQLPEGESAVRSRLLKDGISWSALRYRPGGGLLRKGFEGLRGVARLLRVVLQNKLQVVHARAHPAAIMAFPVVWLLRRKLLFDVRGLVADEYADIGRWSRSGALFRLVKFAERFLLRHADATVFLTRAVVGDLTARGTLRTEDLPRVTVIPCCEEIAPLAPAVDRREFVLAYVGKLGSWYLGDEILRFFLAIRSMRPRSKLLVLTQSPANLLRDRLGSFGLSDDDVWIGAVGHSEVQARLRQASAAVAFYKPGYSKLATSPTKVGEYLAAGLPVAMNAGIGDCDELLARDVVGVSMANFSGREIEAAAAHLVELAETPGIRERCHSVALRDLDLQSVGITRYSAIYAALGA